MPRLVEPLVRLRWLAVPIMAYLVVTLGLPLAHGAARRDGFGHHALWVVLGCVAMFLFALLASLAGSLVRAALHRRTRSPGGSP